MIFSPLGIGELLAVPTNTVRLLSLKSQEWKTQFQFRVGRLVANSINASLPEVDTKRKNEIQTVINGKTFGGELRLKIYIHPP